MNAVKPCTLLLSCAALSLTTLAQAQDGCNQLPDSAQLKKHLRAAPGHGGETGGLFHGKESWAALVDRSGRLCAIAVSTDDPSQVWPGSQSIAKAKAYTANAFSKDSTPLSTARLYTFTQPGHSLWSLGQANPFDPEALATPDDAQKSKGKIAGGLIFFGGGVPLYQKGKIVGGLGVSGDTSCDDHEIAKRIRDLAGLNPPKGPEQDDIQYSKVDQASVYSHPLCPNTYRNGKHIGDEQPAQGY